MRDVKHIDKITNALNMYWKQGETHHLRLGQLIDCAVPDDKDLFFVEDEDLLYYINKFLEGDKDVVL